MKIILWATVVWLPLMMYFMLVNETQFKKNIVLGATLPNQAHQDQDVLKELASFKKNLGIVTTLLIVLAVVFYIVSSENSMTLWGVWVTLAIVGPYIPYIISNQKLRDLKVEKGWYKEEEKVYVNTGAITLNNWLNPGLFIPPIILCLVPLLYEKRMVAMYIMFALMCASFWFGYRYLYRNKAEMVDENVELTKVLSQIRKYNWGKMWLLISYAMAIYALLASLSLYNPVISIALITLLTVIICVYSYRIEMNTRHLQEKLTKDSGKQWYVDDDDKWLFGILYNNPNDSRTIINNRIGVNSTINIATPLGKLLMGFTVLIMLLLPFTGVFMDMVSTADITVEVQDNQVIAKSGITTYTINNEDIKDISLLEELPSDLVRVMGTALPNMLKGDFSSKEMEKMKLILDPTVPPFIRIQTNDGVYYLFGLKDSKDTNALYNLLNE